MRLSIDITPEQHQRLKAAAALKGQSIKDYVLERTLPSPKDDRALQELESFLLPRVAEAQNGGYSTKTVEEIFEEVKQEEQKP